MARLISSSTGWKEERRKRAFLLEAQGWRRCDIAEALGVSRAAVSQWLSCEHEDVAEPWRSTPHPGRAPKLTPKQLQLIPDLLSHGAEAYSFVGEVWTCARIAWVLHDEFGVDYHRAHVSRLLKQLHWTPQMPIERATQRDESEIALWREETWPALKKRP